MIRVRKLVSRPRCSGNLQLAVSGISGVTIATCNLERSVDFYSSVFGLRIATRETIAPRRTATLAAPGEAVVAIHEYGAAPGSPSPLHGRWGFLVDDLDRVRETIWDAGVRVADDNGAPDHIRRWSNGRSLRVLDPDGNGIELIEECRHARAHGCVAAAFNLTFAVQRRPCIAEGLHAPYPISVAGTVVVPVGLRMRRPAGATSR
jgi:catechol 2,3-dioxygenase-like lactoylglutathione lyase family enzyme